MCAFSKPAVLFSISPLSRIVSMFTAPLVCWMICYTRRAVLHHSVMALSSSSVVRVSGPSTERQQQSTGCRRQVLLAAYKCSSVAIMAGKISRTRFTHCSYPSHLVGDGSTAFNLGSSSASSTERSSRVCLGLCENSL